VTLPTASRLSYTPASMRESVPNLRSHRLGLLALAGAFGLSLLLHAGPADAQGKKIVFGEDSELEGSEVIGTVHKPEVGYIITRQEQEDLETLQLKESFIPKIVKSVEKKPF
jgi:hypothetical protein